MITTDKTQLNINVLTQEQYEQAKADETLEDDALYMVAEVVDENPYVEKKTPMFELDTSAQSGVDKELTDALTSLGWLSEVFSGKLLLKKLLAKISSSDLCIETGTNNGWDYRKYANGEFDAVRHVNPTISYTTKATNIYRSSSNTIKLPSFCTSFKYINGQCNGANQWITFANITSDPPEWGVLSAESGTREVNIKFFMRGRWK